VENNGADLGAVESAMHRSNRRAVDPNAVSTSRENYVVEFDTLRALAAIAVICTHFAPFRGIPILGFVEGRLGLPAVDLFFALSGFLITGILLNCKKLLAHQSRTETLGRFYARRFLRIFPLYYLVFFLFLLFGPEGIRNNAAWFLTHTVNFGKVFSESSTQPLNHFWTLAVEEQFYLIWPLVVLNMSLKSILRIAAGAVFVSITARIAMVLGNEPRTAIQQFTYCCLDPLVLGAAVAVLREEQRLTARFLSRISIIAGVLSASLLAFASNNTFEVFGRLSHGLCFASLIGLMDITAGKTAWFMRTRILRYIGRISYGLYVWHLPVLWLVNSESLSTRSALPPGFARLAEFAIAAVLTFLVSAASYQFFEAPINDLKRLFPYRIGGTRYAET
jgi:peptidoglycan/LPS O-acetylase OafA/YrhL